MKTMDRFCVVLLLLLTSCGHAPAPEGADERAVAVRLVPDEADAALAILAAGPSATDSLWSALWSSEGYRRLRQREAALGRAFEDSAFRAFLLSDSTQARRRLLQQTVDSWRNARMDEAAARALAYLPPGSTLRARLYPVIKPLTNSFVFELNTDSAAIFMYVDPAVSREQLENTLAHELHHVGYAAACPGDELGRFPEPVHQVRRWIGAFGEGLAMLAAAGGPHVHPHSVSDPEERARWNRDYASVSTDFARIEEFFEDILAERVEGPAMTQRAMSFFGDAQGPWYTVGYMMTATIERTLGREVLVASICDPVALLETYNRAAADINSRSDAQLPWWSEELLARLRPQ